MKNSEAIHIPANKTMIVLMLIGAIGFVVGGVWIFLDSERFAYRAFSSISLVKVISSICIVFFGVIAFSIINKLFSKHFGVIINQYGINDNSSGVSAGLIVWEDIISYNIQGVASEAFLFIYVKNPDFYIKRKKNIISKMAMKANYKFYKTPIQIPARTISCSLLDLEKHIDNYYKTYSDNNSF